MESLACAEGDLEALIAIKRRDLSSPYRYLDIAQSYSQAGEDEEALRWAEDGLAAFPERRDSRLQLFAANEYHRHGRHDEAMALIWGMFADSPCLSSYEQLKGHAERRGDWADWRARALSHLRETRPRTGPDASDSGWPRGSYVPRSELVDVFLWEGDAEAAWEEAGAHGCSDRQWLELAAAREDEHPEDAIPIYQAEIQRLVELTKNDAYSEATRLLRKVRKLAEGLAWAEEFDEFVAQLKAEYKRKRNFMKMLSDVGPLGRPAEDE